MQMEGYVTNTGNPWYTEKGFVIGTGTVTNPSLENNYMRTTASGNAAGTFFNTLSGLNTPNTTYYIRAYIKNSVGTSYGSTVTYTTPNVPTMSLSNNYTTPYYYSDNVTRYTIREGSVVDSDGGSPLTERGLLFTENSSLAASTPTAATISNNYEDVLTKWVKVAASSASTEDVQIVGYPNTQYYIRAYGTNAYGTGYSSTSRMVKTAVDCGGQLTDQIGNTYGTVKIGHQCWMKQNLKTWMRYDDTYEFGDRFGETMYAIPAGGTSTSTPYYYYPDGNSNNRDQYGELYNWVAATGNSPIYNPNMTYPSGNYPVGPYMTTSQGRHQGICPRGWHIPSADELTTLNSYFGYSVYVLQFNWNQLAGLFDHNGSHPYDEFGEGLNLWGFTENPSNSNRAIALYLTSGGNNINGVYTTTYYEDKDYGLSVRCVQDIAY
jgi:uncharacterized protein (TIGR02145 family)